MKRKILIFLIVISIVISFSVLVKAQDDVQVPEEANSFVEAGAKAIAYEKADLNGDGKEDAILVLERNKPTKERDGYPTDQRPMLILVRGGDGNLAEAVRNEEIVMCSTCGGVFGDPFASIEAGARTFTINHYGGSAWRWEVEYKFKYSRLDRTWQLVRVRQTNFHASDPGKTTKTTTQLPKTFGKVNFADFDPTKFENS